MTITTDIRHVREQVGSRHKISPAEMKSILRAIHHEYGMDSLANSYVPRSFDGQSKQPWLAWMAMLRGCTIISVGDGLRDGNVRYDQPGSMAPDQHAAIIFVRAGGVRRETLDYLRQHCERLLIVSDEVSEAFFPPGVQKQLFAAKIARPWLLDAADSAALDMLWEERNNCPENQIDRIDCQMLKLIAPNVDVPQIFNFECDNGHKWSGKEGQEMCPKCGGYAV